MYEHRTNSTGLRLFGKPLPKRRFARSTVSSLRWPHLIIPASGLFLVFVFGVTIAAHSWIEATIKVELAQKLMAAGLANVLIDVDGQNVSLYGSMSTSEQQEATDIAQNMSLSTWFGDWKAIEEVQARFQTPRGEYRQAKQSINSTILKPAHYETHTGTEHNAAILPSWYIGSDEDKNILVITRTYKFIRLKGRVQNAAAANRILLGAQALLANDEEHKLVLEDLMHIPLNENYVEHEDEGSSSQVGLPINSSFSEHNFGSEFVFMLLSLCLEGQANLVATEEQSTQWSVRCTVKPNDLKIAQTLTQNTPNSIELVRVEILKQPLKTGPKAGPL